MSQIESSAAADTSFVQHLIELRKRLMWMLLALLSVFLIMIPFANRIYAELAMPLLSKLPVGATMIAIDVVTPFFTPVKMAFFTALLATMPIILYQVWAFVAPGLYRHERYFALPLLISSILLFYMGCAFAYFLVLPVLFEFLTAVTPEGVQMMTDISHYLDFILILFFAFGCCFETPVAVIILVILNVVTIKQLEQLRAYIIVGVFVVAAILTPPDIFSQLLLAIPMWLLFEFGLIVARFLPKRQK